MDLKRYYQRIRDLEAKIADEFAVVFSLETADGGKAGSLAEVTAKIAAKMIADGVARLASSEEARRLREQQAEARRAAELAAAAEKVQLSVVPTSELNQLRAAVPPRKG